MIANYSIKPVAPQNIIKFLRNDTSLKCITSRKIIFIKSAEGSDPVQNQKKAGKIMGFR